MAVFEYSWKGNSIFDEKNKNILNEFNNYGCGIIDDWLLVYSYKGKGIF